ncbi:ABC transporter permease [Subtercola lobariae]|uniref:ABC transporter permease n=1 Tax=Subtercola lobariae TaxID=1588641 RepID=UPI001668CB72|nr:ABC transporter permease [Subtercola lobariae]
MLVILLRRLAVSIPLLFAVSFLTFLLVSLTPGDAAYTVLGSSATPDQLAALRQQMGLDQPILVQYLNWVTSALQGNLGHSLITGQSVSEAIFQRLGPTLSLVGIATVAIVVIAVPLGLTSAVRGGRLATSIDTISFAGVAVPNFILALFAIPVFAVWLHWLPPSGYVPLASSPNKWALSLVLPVATLAFGAVGIIAKQTRAAAEDVMSSEFVTVQRANGYARQSIIWKHVLKASAVPIIAYLGVVIVTLFSATVLIETIFAIPGLGGLAVQASSQGDLPMLLGVTVVFTLIIVLINIVLDVVYALVNPKVTFR